MKLRHIATFILIGSLQNFVKETEVHCKFLVDCCEGVSGCYSVDAKGVKNKSSTPRMYLSKSGTISLSF